MKNLKKLIVFTIVVAMSLQVGLIGNNITVKAADYGVDNPRIQNGVSTWDCVYFGSYPQSSAGGNSFKVEPIKWRVLTVDGNNAFLMADKALDCKPYHTTQTAITWKDCSLRTWLNNSFYNEAFNSTEKAILEETDILSTIMIVDRRAERKRVIDTDIGGVLKKQIKELKLLLLAYRKGFIKEHN